MQPLCLKNIKLSYYGKTALEIPYLSASSPLGIIGGSGSGKTNIIKVIAGLEQIDSGEIFIHGKEVGDCKIKDRNISLISPQTPLIKRKSIYKNLVYPLKKRRQNKKSIERAVQQIIGYLPPQITNNFDKRPSVLSSKETSLLLLARALIKNPSIILVDQPHLLKVDLDCFLKKLKECGVFFVITSFDFSLIKDTATEFIIMRRGKIVFHGGAKEIENSRDKFIRTTCFPMEFISSDIKTSD